MLKEVSSTGAGAPARGMSKPRLIFIMLLLICIAALYAKHINAFTAPGKHFSGAALTLSQSGNSPRRWCTSCRPGVFKAGRIASPRSPVFYSTCQAKANPNPKTQSQWIRAFHRVGLVADAGHSLKHTIDLTAVAILVVIPEVELELGIVYYHG